jgi:hypothetical protein
VAKPGFDHGVERHSAVRARLSNSKNRRIAFQIRAVRGPCVAIEVSSAAVLPAIALKVAVVAAGGSSPDGAVCAGRWTGRARQFLCDQIRADQIRAPVDIAIAALAGLGLELASIRFIA